MVRKGKAFRLLRVLYVAGVTMGTATLTGQLYHRHYTDAVGTSLSLVTMALLGVSTWHKK